MWRRVKVDNRWVDIEYLKTGFNLFKTLKDLFAEQLVTGRVHIIVIKALMFGYISEVCLIVTVELSGRLVCPCSFRQICHFYCQQCSSLSMVPCEGRSFWYISASVLTLLTCLTAFLVSWIPRSHCPIRLGRLTEGGCPYTGCTAYVANPTVSEGALSSRTIVIREAQPLRAEPTPLFPWSTDSWPAGVVRPRNSGCWGLPWPQFLRIVWAFSCQVWVWQTVWTDRQSPFPAAEKNRKTLSGSR